MTKKPEPEWHSEARYLRLQGMGYGKIAVQLGKAESTVVWLFNDNQRDATYWRVRRNRALAAWRLGKITEAQFLKMANGPDRRANKAAAA